VPSKTSSLITAKHICNNYKEHWQKIFRRGQRKKTEKQQKNTENSTIKPLSGEGERWSNEKRPKILKKEKLKSPCPPLPTPMVTTDVFKEIN